MIATDPSGTVGPWYRTRGLNLGALLWRGRWTHVVRLISGAGLAFGLILLLPLHASVLEPDLNLPLGEAKRVRDLDPPSPRQVPVEVELLLQLKRLVPRVSLPSPLPF